ncbi:MAG: DUF1722 domain-containing protein [Deltaproteobacteria bacterium]|nr:MAG: DUF1722 domain-containing protein [Deltaproteobacteria bacterium]
MVPTTLINRYMRKYRQPYLDKQTHLRPHPLAFQFWNHV